MGKTTSGYVDSLNSLTRLERCSGSGYLEFSPGLVYKKRPGSLSNLTLHKPRYFLDLGHLAFIETAFAAALVEVQRRHAFKAKYIAEANCAKDSLNAMFEVEVHLSFD